MPAAAPLLVPVVSGIITGASIGSILLSVGSAIVLGALSRALAPKPKKPSLSGGGQVRQGITQTFRQPITTHKHIYGVKRVSGPFAYFASTNSNEFLHLVIVLAAHEVESINEVWVNDVVIPNDAIAASGNVSSGRYNSFIRIKKLLGTPTQAADADIIAEIAELDSNFRGVNRAGLYVRLKYSQDKFPGGIPNLSAVVNGKKLFDTRDSTEKFTTNAPLYVRDYLSKDYGFAALDGELNDTKFTSSANIADEIVDTQNDDVEVDSISTSTNIITLSEDNDLLRYQIGDRVRVVTTDTAPGGLDVSTDYYVIPYQYKDNPRIKLATSLANAMANTEISITDTGTGTHTIRKTGEPRYHGGGVLDTDTELENNINDMLTSMAGRTIWTGGEWQLFVGAYVTPTIELSEDDIVGNVIYDTRLENRERFNSIQGVYVTPLSDFVPTDYPQLRSSTFVTQDNGEELPKELDQPYTTRPLQAQRVAKIELLRSRQEQVFKAPFNMKALRAQTGENINLSVTQYGFSSKAFEVTNFRFRGAEDDQGALNVELTLRETASEIFDFDTSEESNVDPAPNSNLPNAFDVTVVTGFSLDSVLVSTQAGDKVYNVRVTWIISENFFVQSGGWYEINFKEATLTDYIGAGRVDGSTTEFFLNTLKPDTLYDIQIVPYNNLGIAGQPTTIEDFTAGDTVITETEDWENETLDRDGDDWENDTLTSEDFEA